jgi:hypothetical protein
MVINRNKAAERQSTWDLIATARRGMKSLVTRHCHLGWRRLYDREPGAGGPGSSSAGRARSTL